MGLKKASTFINRKSVFVLVATTVLLLLFELQAFSTFLAIITNNTTPESKAIEAPMTSTDCGLDLFLINDQSGSVDALENIQSRAFISALATRVNGLGIANSESRFSISEFAHTNTWYRYAFASAGANYTIALSDVLLYESAARTLSGGTSIYRAMQEARTAVSSNYVSGRTTPKVVVLMTDAYCFQIEGAALNIAQELKDDGFYIVVMAIGPATACTALNTIASPGGYFSAVDYQSLENDVINLTENIINSACGAPPFEYFYDLAVNITSFTASGCNTPPGTFSADFTVTNVGEIDFNANLKIAFYNRDPTSPSADHLITIDAGTQNITTGGGSYNGTITSLNLETTNLLYAVVNIDGALGINSVPLTYGLTTSQLNENTEKNTNNNFSSGTIRVDAGTCAPQAKLFMDVTNTGLICDGLLTYEVNVCNNGNADAKINPTPYVGAGFSLNDLNVIPNLASILNADKQQVFGGSLDELANASPGALETSDGNYLNVSRSSSGISGNKTSSSRGGIDYWIIKHDKDGNILWQKRYGGDADDVPTSMDNTTDGGYIIGGYSLSSISGDKTGASKGGEDYWIIKLNSSGNIQWQRTFGGTSNDNLTGIIQTSDGGYLVSGHSYSGISGDKTSTSFGQSDYWVLKLNASGNIVWQRIYGGSDPDIIPILIGLANGDYFMFGYSYSSISGNKTENNIGSSDYWAVRINSTGSIVWQKNIGGSGIDLISRGNTPYETSSGNILIQGYSSSNSGGDKSENSRGASDMWVIKLDGTTGALLKEKTIGGTGYDAPGSIKELPSGNFMLLGTSASNISGEKSESSKGSSDVWILEVDTDLNVLWDKTIGGTGGDGGRDFIYDVQDNSYQIFGYSSSGISGDKTVNSYGGNDAWTFRLKEFQVLEAGECASFQYTYDVSGTSSGTYDFSVGLEASSVSVIHQNPSIAPDINFNAGSATNLGGFDGTAHTSDDVVVVPTSSCPSGDLLSIAIDIPENTICEQGYTTARITITNNSGGTFSNIDLALNLTGTNTTYASEPYGFTNGLVLPSVNTYHPSYPAVSNALYNGSGTDTLDIYTLPNGISTFTIDLAIGTGLANLSAQLLNIPTGYNATNESNIGTDATGITGEVAPTISGTCPASISAATTTINFNYTVTGATSIQWASGTSGIFTNPNAAATNYTVNVFDIANGFVDVSIKGMTAGGCETVETCRVNITGVAYDYGDAPTTYDLGYNVIPVAAASTLLPDLYLGTVAPDTETNAQANIDATGDGSDEDAMDGVSVLQPSSGAVGFTLPVEVTNNSVSTAYLSAFIDWNEDGDFLDTLERSTIVTIPASSGLSIHTPVFDVPNITIPDSVFLRLRLSIDASAIEVPYGAAAQGEVEDILFAFCADIDGDNICEEDDIDDDNDGIRDVDECPAIYRFNVGGGAYTDTRGRVWSVETGLSGGNGAGTHSSDTVNLDSGNLPGSTTDDTPYISYRSAGSSSTFTYALPISNGNYRVIFHWRDCWPNGNGRKINIALEGINVITNYNPKSEFGDCVAGTRIFTTTVSDGNLDISFGGTGSPILYALEVFNEDCDTDNDGTPDYLDLDSDGDGCYDKIEASVTGFTTDGSVTDSLAATTAAEVGANGLDDDIESDDSQSATTAGSHSGNYTITQTNSGTNDFQDINIQIACPPTSCNINTVSNVEAVYTFETSTVIDVSGNGHHPSNTPGLTYSSDAVEGNISAGYNTSGIQLNDGTFLNNSFTYRSLSMFIKPSVLNTNQVLYDEGGSTNGMLLKLNSSGNLQLTVTESNTRRTASIAFPNDGEWHHVGFVYDGGSTNLAWLYLDGYPVDAVTGFNSRSGASNSGGLLAQFSTAADNGSGTRAYTGLVDDVAIYNIALTPKNMLDIADCVGDNFLTDFDPMNCPATAFQVQGLSSQWNSINLLTGDDTQSNDAHSSNLNAIGYNLIDNRIWGYNDAANDATLSVSVQKTDGTWNTQLIGPIAGLPTLTYNTGDIDENGVLFLTANALSGFYKVDLNPTSSTYLQYLGSTSFFGTFTSMQTADWAFNPVDGMLYGIRRTDVSSPHYLVQVNPVTGQVRSLGSSGATCSVWSGYGAVFFDADGFFYAYCNSTGNVYRLNLSTVPVVSNFSSSQTVLFTNSVSGLNLNDGARCASVELPIDFGDAPNSYNTSLASDGPRHLISNYDNVNHTSDLSLGKTVDYESGAKASTLADGDGMDDDGILFPILNPGETYNKSINLINTTGGNVYLNVWIDYNRDGDFYDSGEQLLNDQIVANNATSATLTFTVPAGASLGNSFARLRICNGSGDCNTITGSANAGEVEDYQIEINTPEICENGLDDDGDGLIDCEDPDCYLASNSGDTDTDADGIGDSCDLDDDNDGIRDVDEGLICLTFNNAIWVNNEDDQIIEISNINGTPTQTNVVTTSHSGWIGDIGFAPNGQLYQVRQNSNHLYRVNLSTGSVTSVAVIPFSDTDWDVNSVSFDENGLAYVGSSSSSEIHRINPENGTSSIWKTFSGNAAGDFIFLNGLVYIAWRPTSSSSNVRLYGVVIDDDNNYVSHQDLGKLPNNTFGLSSDGSGVLFGGTGSGNIFSFVPPTSSVGVISTTLLYDLTGGDQVYGLTSTVEAVGNGCQTVDTDMDGIDDHLDLDSDGDGCYDKIEAGVTGFTTNGSITDSLAASTAVEVGTNGLDDDIESDDSQSATTSGTYTIIQTNSGTNDFQDASVSIGCLVPEICGDGLDNDGDGLTDCEDPDCYLVSNTGGDDLDGDGVGDACDIDDDNDGVLDANESEDSFDPVTVLTQKTAQASGSGIGGLPSINIDIPQGSNENRALLLYFIAERDHTGDGTPNSYGDNYAINVPGSVSNYDPFTQDNMFTISSSSHSISASYNPVTNDFNYRYKTSLGLGELNAKYSIEYTIVYLLESDLDALCPSGFGNIDINFDLLGTNLPASGQDETLLGVIVLDNVKQGLASEQIFTEFSDGVGLGLNSTSSTLSALVDADHSPKSDFDGVLMLGHASNENLTNGSRYGYESIPGYNLVTDGQILNNAIPSNTYTYPGVSSEGDGFTYSLQFGLKKDITIGTSTSLSFYNSTSNTLIDNAGFSFIKIQSAVEETDGDGLPDHRDLDSDGDGCFDIAEAGVTGYTTNGSIRDSLAASTGLEVGANGLANNIESDDTQNATVNYTVVQTNTGVNDFQDASISTGCVEICGDGLDNDSDGLIDCDDPDCYLVSNTGGEDLDGDGIDDFCDIDDDNDGILDLNETARGIDPVRVLSQNTAQATGSGTGGLPSLSIEVPEGSNETRAILIYFMGERDHLADGSSGTFGDNWMVNDPGLNWDYNPLSQSDILTIAGPGGTLNSFYYGLTDRYSYYYNSVSNPDNAEVSTEYSVVYLLESQLDNLLPSGSGTLNIDFDLTDVQLPKSLQDETLLGAIVLDNVKQDPSANGAFENFARERSYDVDSSSDVLTATVDANAIPVSNFDGVIMLGLLSNESLTDGSGYGAQTIPNFETIIDGQVINNSIPANAFTANSEADGFSYSLQFGLNKDLTIGTQMSLNPHTSTGSNSVMSAIYTYFKVVSASEETDGDGMPDHRDLDSDGDGCFDVAEAGVTGFTTNGSITDSLAASSGAEVGINGLDNSIESNDTRSATTSGTHPGNYNIIQTNTGVNDFQDASISVACVEICGDGLDNDSDGLIDCDDPDCITSPTINLSLTTACVNEVITISSSDLGVGTTYSWNFGNNASPATASGIGPHNVSYTNCGSKTASLTVQRNSCSITVDSIITIQDTTDPVWDVAPSNLVLECNSSQNLNDSISLWLGNHGGGTASDNCNSFIITNDYTALSAACGTTGSTSVQFTARDSCGNTAMSTASISILDTEGPSISIVDDITVDCDNIPVAPSPTVADSCDTSPTLAYQEVTVYHPNANWRSTSTCDILHAISAVTYNNQGTPGDSSDDEMRFTLTVLGQNTSAGWSANVNGTLISGTYQRSYNFGPLLSGGSILSFTIIDDSDPACTRSVTINAADF